MREERNALSFYGHIYYVLYSITLNTVKGTSPAVAAILQIADVDFLTVL